MFKKIPCIAVLLISFSWNTALAVVIGGSNIAETFDYPSHSCTKPARSTRLFKPMGIANTYEIEQYNSEVKNYNANYEKYIECIKQYIDNANRDMERIREKANEAVAEANK